MSKPPLVWTAVVVFYTGVVLLMLAPISNYAAFSSAIDSGDPKLLAWTFAWTSHAILTGHSLFDANIFYPASPALQYAEHSIGVGIWGLPLYAITHNAVLVYNVLRVLALVLDAVAMHVFVWRWQRRHGPALIAGLVFGVSAERLLYIGHVPIVWNCWMPLLLLVLDRWLEERRWIWAWVASILFALQALATSYLAVLTTIAALLFVAWFVVSRRPSATLLTMKRLLPQAAAGLVLAAVMLWPFSRPYVALAAQEQVMTDQAQRLSADMGSYVQPHEHALAGPLITRLTGLQTRRVGSERAQFLGLVTIALALIGAVRLLQSGRRRAADETARADWLWGGYFVVLFIVALVLSFGPSSEGGMPMPFDAIAHMPLLNMFRVPARFAILVVMATAGLAALGWGQILRVAGRAGAVATALVIPVLLFEWAVVPPAGERPKPDVVPPIYQLIAKLDVHAMVSLPCNRLKGGESPLDADYMLWSTINWTTIVNGYGRADPDGSTWVIGTVNGFPGPNSAARMRKIGIDYIVVNTRRYPDGAALILGEALSSRDFELVAQVAGDYLFHVRPAS